MPEESGGDLRSRRSRSLHDVICTIIVTLSVVSLCVNNNNNTNTEESGHKYGPTIPVEKRWKRVDISGRAYSVTGFLLLGVK